MNGDNDERPSGMRIEHRRENSKRRQDHRHPLEDCVSARRCVEDDTDEPALRTSAIQVPVDHSMTTQLHVYHITSLHCQSRQSR